MKWDVFICHESKTGDDFASHLWSALLCEGISAFIDHEHLPPGIPWGYTRDDALKGCNYFVVVGTQLVIKSGEVKNEITMAATENKRLLPFRHELLDRDEFLGIFPKANLQVLDFDTKEDLARKVIHQLRREKPTFTGLTARPRARTTITLPKLSKASFSFKLDLRKGWNLVSLPSAPLSADLAINLDTKAADIDRVTTFSATSGRWYDVIRSGTPPKHLWAGSLSTLGAGQGYFILANKATAVTINLKPVEILSTSPILNLTAGWNLIGFVTNKLETKHKLSQILNSLKATAVYGFDETKGYPLKMNIGADWAELGKGYWVYLEKAGKLEL